MGVVHNHYIIRAEVSSPFTKPKKVKKWLKKIVDAIGMKICKHGGPYVDYVEVPGNCGIAAVVMIETSHISLHVWDQLESPLVQFDAYSCAPFDCNVVLHFLDEMNIVSYQTLLLDRSKYIQRVEETVYKRIRE